MKDKSKMIKTFSLCLALLLCAGCLSVMEKTGNVIDGSAFAEKRLALYRALEKDGDAADMEISIVEGKKSPKSIIITLKQYPMIKLRGSLPDETGNFYLNSLDYLAGSVQGWNEYSLELLGGGLLSLGDKAVIQITEEIEPIQITAARIHRYDSRITGDEALTGLRNRRERIIALVEWMRTQEGPTGQNIGKFEDHWKAVFFPELVSKKKRPQNWQQEGDIFVRAEDIRWNTSYTERVFSEELWPVRNSATLLRDWEEALPWIYYEYEWGNITELLSRHIFLQKIK